MAWKTFSISHGAVACAVGKMSLGASRTLSVRLGGDKCGRSAT